jgi:uncharacterized protein YegJ (DUF2314 family)
MICAALLAIAVGIWFWRRRQKRLDEPPPDSIVLLLKQPKRIEVRQLADLFGSVSGRSVSALVHGTGKQEIDDTRPAGDVVAGASPHFIAKVEGTWFTIHNVPTPYMDDPAQASESFREARLRNAIRDHHAWLSVEIIQPKAATPEAYRVLARVLAHFIDADCLALYSPPLNRFAPCIGDKTVAKLQSDDPVKSIFREVDEVPVIPVDDDDPRLKSAEAEARRRFSEFETAFERKDGTRFAIKTKITSHGNSEHIWVEVARITGSQIEGRLGNDPVDLADLKLGSKVEVERSQVEDWAFLRNGSPVGLFTVAVIQQIEQDR